MNFLDPKARQVLDDLAKLLAANPTETSIRLAITNAYQLGVCDGKLETVRALREPA